MFHIKRKQQQSAFHFANNPQQSIEAFPNTFHITTTAVTGTSVSNSVSSKSVGIQSSSSSSVSSFITTTTTATTQTTPSSSLPVLKSSSLSPSSPAVEKPERSKLSTGAIAGIAVGGTCILIGLFAIVILLFLRRRNVKKDRLSIENTKEKKLIEVQNEKQYSETSSPSPLANNQYFVNDEDMFWNAHPIGTFRVFSTYTQTLDDELYIQPGDKVQIYTQYDDGWCLGINLTRGGSRGVFPQHCINIERPL